MQVVAILLGGISAVIAVAIVLGVLSLIDEKLKKEKK
jgi:hypothetical protein